MNGICLQWARYGKDNQLSNIFGREIVKKQSKTNKKKNLYFLQIFVMEIFFKSVLLQYLETVETSEKEEHLGLLGLEEVEESSPWGGFGRNSVRPIHSFWTFTFQACEKIHFSCVKPLNSDTSLQQP